MSPLDLHVLSTPPAFVLSQDQTLSFNPVISNRFIPARLNSFGITVSFLRYFLSVSFSRFRACSQALPLASQLVYLIKLKRESQHLFDDFYDFFAKFFVFRTAARKHFRPSAFIRTFYIIRRYDCSSILRCASAPLGISPAKSWPCKIPTTLYIRARKTEPEHSGKTSTSLHIRPVQACQQAAQHATIRHHHDLEAPSCARTIFSP